jgi:hypothetical protein
MQRTKLQELADIALTNNAAIISLTEAVLRLMELAGAGVPQSDSDNATSKRQQSVLIARG